MLEGSRPPTVLDERAGAVRLNEYTTLAGALDNLTSARFESAFAETDLGADKGGAADLHRRQGARALWKAGDRSKVFLAKERSTGRDMVIKMRKKGFFSGGEFLHLQVVIQRSEVLG